MMKILVITGNIGSGKSVASRILADNYDVPVYDSDSRAKLLYDKYPSIVSQIENSIPDKTISAKPVSLRGEDGRLDKGKLASMIFSDKRILAVVESIVHPMVLRDFEVWAADFRDRPLVVFESAIILTKPLFAEFGDWVLEVTAPEEVRLERACLRDNAPREAVAARICTQAAQARLREPDFVIDNSGNPDSLKSELLSLYLYLSALPDVGRR